MNTIAVRKYKAEDAGSIAQLYYHTIHNINSHDYTEEQVNVWAPYDSVKDYSGWQEKLAKIQPFVATINDIVVGFAEFEPNGHIDCFYVHHEYQGKSIGSALMAAIFNEGKKQKINRIYAEVSITAKPFFEAKGFKVVKEQTVNLRGVELKNFVMERYYQLEQLSLSPCASDIEWQAAKTYRHKYFFGKVPMDDPYLWTFGHKDHQHFILYHGTSIIGYAHIQLWPEYRAGMRIIVLDEDKRRSGFGRWFMEKIEAGLKESGFTSLHAESNPGALSFYTALGYTPMPFNDPGGDECGPPDIPVGKILNATKDVCASYDKIINWFDNARTKTLMEKEYLDVALSHLKPGASILDLGCGTGEPIAKFFIDHGMKITGIDGSPNMVALCKERFPEQQWQVGDMRHISLGRRFDAILAWDSFFHLPQDAQRRMFSLFKEHIAEGGILIFTSGPKEGEVYGMMDSQSFYHASLSLEEYRKLLAEHGFTVLLHKVEDPDCGEHTVWVAKYNAKMHDNELDIDEPIVTQLLTQQFPEFANLSIKRLTHSGTDHAIFRLGDEYAIRLPRVSSAEEQMVKEQEWLLKLGQLPLITPNPIANGKPSNDYPYHWYVYRWIEGINAYDQKPADLHQAARDLAAFIKALWKVDTAGAPPTRRGLPLSSQDRDVWVNSSAAELKSAMDESKISAIMALWEKYRNTPGWSKPPVWLHGDLLPSNLLIQDGKLHAVIDFGLAGIGDPACDMIPAWSLFDAASRAAFKEALGIDEDTWNRGKGWALSIAVIIIPYYLHTNPVLVSVAKRMIEEILVD